MNASYISKEFKKETGKGVQEWICDIRLLKAEEKIRGGKNTISEIASSVGYPDNNYFTKLFKAKYGLSPMAYRKKNN